MSTAEVLAHPVRSFVTPRDELPGYRAESRTSAYIYGEVLVLAAAAAVDGGELRSGAAVLVVLGTVISTYLAHVLADTGGAALAGRASWAMLRAEIRDSLPVVSAGGPVIVLFGAAALGWPSVLWAQSLACVVVIARLAALGLVYRRLQPEMRVHHAVAVGVMIAVVGAMAAGLKLVLVH